MMSVDEDDVEFSDLEASTEVWCPYCGEAVELLIDTGGGGLQEYVEDCEVCCQPWRVRLRISPDGSATAELATLDEA